MDAAHYHLVQPYKVVVSLLIAGIIIVWLANASQ